MYQIFGNVKVLQQYNQNLAIWRFYGNIVNYLAKSEGFTAILSNIRQCEGFTAILSNIWQPEGFTESHFMPIYTIITEKVPCGIDNGIILQHPIE